MNLSRALASSLLRVGKNGFYKYEVEGKLQSGQTDLLLRGIDAYPEVIDVYLGKQLNLSVPKYIFKTYKENILHSSCISGVFVANNEFKTNIEGYGMYRYDPPSHDEAFHPKRYRLIGGRC